MENIKLWESGTPMFDPSIPQEEPDLTPFLLPEEKDENGEAKKRGCVIVCPGGGYTHRGDLEGEPIAKMFNENGFSSFVLNYRFGPYNHSAIVSDVKRAIRVVRYNAEKFGIDPEKIAIIGFSAGGHLSSVAATHFDYGVEGGDLIDAVSSRPDAALLCYSVITMDKKYTDDITRGVFIGNLENEEELALKYSSEHQVREDGPPVFMWHTAGDPIVPVQNAIQMASALAEKHIPFEFHVFPEGAHGLNLAKDTPGTCQWPRIAVNWLKRMEF